MAQRTINPARWCPDCKRRFARVSGVEVFTDGPRNGARKSRCRGCLVRLKRLLRKQQEQQARQREATRPLLPGEHCTVCEGLGHRRPLSGCPRCKLAHVPLPPIQPVLRKFDWAV